MFDRIRDGWGIFLRQPPACRLLWCLLWAGAALAWAGYLHGVPWQSFSGLGLVVAVFVLAVLGMKWRPEWFGEFAGGLFVGLVIGVPVFLLFFAVSAVAFVIFGINHGFTPAAALRGLHFTALLAGTSMILSLPTAMRSVGGRRDRPDVSQR
jgi:hypothetical protein